MFRKWLITALSKSPGSDATTHVPFYVAGDGVAYTKANEVLRSTAVRKQLDDVRKLRELAVSEGRSKVA